MEEIPGSENQIRTIIFLVKQKHADVYYRKTKDSNGDDYFLILNTAGKEVAEWDDDTETWVLIPHPRSTGNIHNRTEISHLSTLIEKQSINMSLCKGKLAQLPRRNVKKRNVRRGP